MEALNVECKKCGAVITASMMVHNPRKCPFCDEPDVRFFDLDKSDWTSGEYPRGEEEEST